MYSTDDVSNSPKVTTALEPTARRQIPITQSIEKGQWIVTQIFGSPKEGRVRE